MVLLLAGCNSSGDKPRSSTAADGAPRSPREPARTSYDPPHVFDAASAVALPKEAGLGNITFGGTIAHPLPVTLYRTLAYVAAPDTLQAVDTGTGKILATVRPQREAVMKPYDASAGNPTPPPVLTQSGGNSLVVLPFLVKVPASGTTPGTYAVEMTSVDATTARTTKHTEITLPPWASAPYNPLTATVVGAESGIAVLRVSDDSHAVTYAVNVASHEIIWQKAFAAEAVTDGVVAGMDAVGIGQQRHLESFLLTTGKPLWPAKEASHEESTTAAGPHLILFSGRWNATGNPFVQLLDARTGQVKNTVDGPSAGLTCSSDGKSATVCATKNGISPRAFAIDAKDARLLWQLPDSTANRVAPDVTAVWNGTVYGTTDAGPVLLDAQTGADIKASPGIAPVIVNGYTGIALDQHSTVMAYRTTG